MKTTPFSTTMSWHNAHDTKLRHTLLNCLNSLEYPAFEEVVRELLLKMGYQDVRSTGRRFRRGRTRSGGMDLSVTTQTGITRSRLLLQAKQYRRPVSRRFVDELAGACLRSNAWGGILVATSQFSRAAHRAAAEITPPRVRLMGGDELLSLLISYRIGLVEQRDGRLALDESYFTALPTSREQSIQRAAPHPQRFFCRKWRILRGD